MTYTSPKKTPKSRNPLLSLILRWNKYFRLTTIVYLPVLLSVIVLIIGFMVGEQIYQNQDVPQKFIGTVFLIMSLLASVSGFIQILIGEVPGLAISVRGKLATFIGAMWILFFGLLAIGIIYYYFIH